jgi:crotonobetainyl-CoA:carnitine CoA-transferase CaiB-like acyl-CoA transferase
VIRRFGMSAMALKGIRVIDLTMAWSGPLATMLLAHMGAEVIKIESVLRIDSWRSIGPEGPVEGWWNRAPTHNTMCLNKYGITLNLGHPRGVAIFKQLVKIGDIVAENYTPRVLESWGLHYPVLRELNPDLIMLSMPGSGMTGPWRHHAGFAASVEQNSGLPIRVGYLDGEPTLHNIGIALGDPFAGLNGAVALLLALHWRQVTGKGQYIDLSQNEALTCLNGDAIMDYTLNRRVQGRRGNRHPSMAPHGCYRCQGEDMWAAISISSDEEWESFTKAIGSPAWTKEERFADCLSRWQNQDELDKLIEAWTAEHDHYQVMHILQAAGVAAAPALTSPELLGDPHLEQRGFFEFADHAEMGLLPYPGMFYKLSKTPGSIRMAAPCLGQHNEYILGELLGLSKDEIAELAAEQVIGTHPLGTGRGGSTSGIK